MSVLSRPVRDRSRDKALLIGFEYHNCPHPNITPLYGIHDDVKALKKHLVEFHGYLENNVKLMLDGDRSTSCGPTVHDVEHEIHWLTRDAKPGDRLIFCFAGHGYQLRARDGSHEFDKKDEAIFIDTRYGAPVCDGTIDRFKLPPDHSDKKKLQGIIVDNRLRRLLVGSLPGGVHLYTFWDTCHSGSLLDLPFEWCIRDSQFRKLSVSDFDRPATSRRSTVQASRRSASMRSIFPDPDLPEIIEDAVRCTSPMPITYQDGEQPYVISISSSEDYQSTFGKGEGSMIKCLISVLEKSPQGLTTQTLGLNLERKMRNRRTKAFDKAWHAQRGEHVNTNQKTKLRNIQLPQFGTMTADGPNLRFKL